MARTIVAISQLHPAKSAIRLATTMNAAIVNVPFQCHDSTVPGIPVTRDRMSELAPKGDPVRLSAQPMAKAKPSIVMSRPGSALAVIMAARKVTTIIGGMAAFEAIGINATTKI